MQERPYQSTPPANATFGKSLTRLAYRWVKGAKGWTEASIGSEEDNERIPNDDGDLPFDDDVECAGSRLDANLIKAPLIEKADAEKEADGWSEL